MYSSHKQDSTAVISEGYQHVKCAKIKKFVSDNPVYEMVDLEDHTFVDPKKGPVPTRVLRAFRSYFVTEPYEGTVYELVEFDSRLMPDVNLSTFDLIESINHSIGFHLQSKRKQRQSRSKKRFSHVPSGLFYRRIRNIPTSNAHSKETSQVNVRTIMTGNYELNEVLDFKNSYAEKSSKYATYSNLSQICFVRPSNGQIFQITSQLKQDTIGRIQRSSSSLSTSSSMRGLASSESVTNFAIKEGVVPL